MCFAIAPKSSLASPRDHPLSLLAPRLPPAAPHPGGTVGETSRAQRVRVLQSRLCSRVLRCSPSPYRNLEGSAVEICRNWSAKIKGATVVLSLPGRHRGDINPRAYRGCSLPSRSISRATKQYVPSYIHTPNVFGRWQIGVLGKVRHSLPPPEASPSTAQPFI